MVVASSTRENEVVDGQVEGELDVEMMDLKRKQGARMKVLMARLDEMLGQSQRSGIEMEATYSAPSTSPTSSYVGVRGTDKKGWSRVRGVSGITSHRPSSTSSSSNCSIYYLSPLVSPFPFIGLIISKAIDSPA